MRKAQNRILSSFIVAAVLITAGCTGGAESAVKTYALGETAEAGAFGFQVNGCDWRTRIGEGPDAKTAIHSFLVLQVGVFNRSPSDLAIPAMTLLDEDGQAHSEVPGVTADPRWLGLSHKARANEITHGNVIFDVPPGHYRLRVTDESGFDKFALIDIPLRIQTDFEAVSPR
jgi:hypothetical protein